MNFENFYTGNTYKYEFSVAETVAADPNGKYSPLVFFGPGGTGKTHLIYAIADRVTKSSPEYKVLLINADYFVNEMIEAIRKRESQSFRKKYYNADILLIDNFEFVAEKSATQEEIFGIFNHLINNNKQIILTVNGNLSDLKFDEKIKSFFHRGVMLRMKLPNERSRTDIARKMAENFKIDIDEESLRYIVDNSINAAQIEGILKSYSLRSVAQTDEI